MSAARRAALALHALGASDRHWILGQLGQAHRDVLTPLLGELGRLGIPADPDVVQAALRDVNVQRSTDPDARVQAIWEADLSRMLVLLRGESDELVARLLNLRAWPWAAALLERLGPTRARGIEALRASLGATAEGLADALLRVTTERLQDDAWRVMDPAAQARGRGRFGWNRRTS